MKIVLNETAIKNLGEGTYYDAKQRGLYLKISKGSMRLGFYAWLAGKPFRRAIGRWPEVSITAARGIAAEILVEKPKERKRLSYVVTKYVSRCELKQHRTAYMKELAETYWGDFVGKTLDTVTVLDLQDKHDEIVKSRGPQAARRAILGMRTLFNHAIKLQITDRNPALGVETAPQSSRDVFLTSAEIKIMRECLEEMDINSRHFFLLALMTGIRRRNITGMLWVWVDMENALVNIPAAHSKNKREMTIPLIPQALEILRQRYAVRTCDKVFQTSDVPKWIIELRHRMREKGVTKHFHVHDMRRTAATQLVAAGVSMPIISQFLGHVNMGSTKVYARADTGMVRQAITSALT